MDIASKNEFIYFMQRAVEDQQNDCYIELYNLLLRAFVSADADFDGQVQTSPNLNWMNIFTLSSVPGVTYFPTWSWGLISTPIWKIFFNIKESNFLQPEVWYSPPQGKYIPTFKCTRSNINPTWNGGLYFPYRTNIFPLSIIPGVTFSQPDMEA